MPSKGALDADGSHVDMTKRRGDKQDGHDGVNRVGDLHGEAGLPPDREIEDNAGYPHGGSEDGNKPEPSLLAGVDLSDVGPGSAADIAAHVLEPVEVHLLGDVVAHPENELQKNPDKKQRPAIIVQHLRRLKISGIGPVAEDRYQQDPPQEEAQTRDGHDDEQHGRIPVQDPLPCGIALDLHPGPRFLHFVGADAPIEQAHDHERDGDDPLGKRMQGIRFGTRASSPRC